MRRLLVGLLLVLTAGCANRGATSVPLPFDAELPQGYTSRSTKGLFLATKEGLPLQSLDVSRKNVKDEKQFAYTRKRVAADMLPQELAEVVIDDFQSDKSFPVEAVEENAPETVAGQPGFRVRLSFVNGDGLRYRCQIYGFLAEEWFYQITYMAPARYYFDRDLPAVQKMAGSFRLVAAQAAEQEKKAK